VWPISRASIVVTARIARRWTPRRSAVPGLRSAIAKTPSDSASSRPSELSSAGPSDSSPSAIVARCSATGAVHQPPPTSTGISVERRSHPSPVSPGSPVVAVEWLRRSTRPAAIGRRADGRTRADDESRQWRRRHDRLRVALASRHITGASDDLARRRSALDDEERSRLVSGPLLLTALTWHRRQQASNRANPRCVRRSSDRRGSDTDGGDGEVRAAG